MFNTKGCNDEAKDIFGSIVMEAPEAEIKEMLIKMKLENSYEANVKVLISHDVKLVQDTLKYLEGNFDVLTKDGVIYRIMTIIYSLMPHKCSGCREVVSASTEGREN